MMHRIGLQQRLRGQATAVEVVVDGLTKMHAAGEHAQRQFDQRLPTQRRVAKGERALIVKQAHARFTEAQGFEALVIQTIEIGHADINTVVRQMFEDLFGTQRRHFEAQIRVGAVQALHQRQRIEARQRHYAQPQRADQVAATRRCFRVQTVISRHHRARPRQHALARRGEPFKALATVDQLQVEFFFEAAQAHRQGWLGDVATRGGLAEVAGFVEGDEEFQLLDVHLRSGGWQGWAILPFRGWQGHWSAWNRVCLRWSRLGRLEPKSRSVRYESFELCERSR
ncbi:hypothetical protein EMIT0347P_50131 [Pseudomonas sp. IT-347P]